MAKKGGKKSFWDNPFGGLFDFNRDGKEDFCELWIARKIFEECTKEDPQLDYSSDYICHPTLDDFVDTSWRECCEDGSEFDLDPEDYETEAEYNAALEEAKQRVAWRETCEDGSEFDIDPEDYETEEEYDEALEEARNAWRDICEDGSEYGLDPNDFETEDEYNDALEEARELAEASAATISLHLSVECPEPDGLEEIKEENYPNKRRHNAAYALANEFLYYGGEEKACCHFILDKADEITAANYLTYEDGFLYAQAIKDNFKLPVSLPDEDECREYELSEALRKIAKRNIALSFEVWEWALDTFLPYTKYARGSLDELTSDVLDGLYNFPESYRIELARYMSSHPDFLEKIVDEKANMASDLDMLIADALQDGLVEVAVTLFKRGLAQAGNNWKKINALTQNTISYCENYDELESAEYFKLNMLPLVKAIDIGMVQDEIDEWEKDLDEYISQVESDCEQYAYTRKNAWRKTVPDGVRYGLDPRDYDSEREYLEALEEGKRDWYEENGPNIIDFETHRKACNTRLGGREGEEEEGRGKEEEERREEEEGRGRWIERECENCSEKDIFDDKIYTFCGVLFPGGRKIYHYRVGEMSIKVGDEVLVPVGGGEREVIGKVVSIGQYMGMAAPYPVEKTKFILGKTEEK